MIENSKGVWCCSNLPPSARVAVYGACPPAHQEDRSGRAPDRGDEARARQVDNLHASQEAAANGRHAAAKGHSAPGLLDMRHADSRHSGTEHARTRLASEGRFEYRRRLAVPRSEEGANGLDGSGARSDCETAVLPKKRPARRRPPKRLPFKAPQRSPAPSTPTPGSPVKLRSPVKQSPTLGASATHTPYRPRPRPVCKPPSDPSSRPQ